MQCESLKSLRWHRLSATLLNIRSSQANTAHPVTIMESIIKGVTSSIKDTDQPFVCFHVKDRKYTFGIQESEKIPLEIFFYRSTLDYVIEWKKVLEFYLMDPVTGKNFNLLDSGEIEERSYEKLVGEVGHVGADGEICLEFLTPFPFKPEEGKQRTYIAPETFIGIYEKRFSRLFGKDISYKSHEDRFFVLPYYWNYTEIRHSSKSQPGQVQYINGCVGPLYVKGYFKDFLPFIILGSEIHAGTKLSNSQGYYRFYKEPPGFFTRYFPNRKSIHTMIRDVLDGYDNALQSLSETEQFPFDEEKYAEKLCQQIADDTYLPSPSTAFTIKKKGGVERVVEQMSFKDLIVQQYLLKTISGIFERTFEEESIGFRKGIPRQKAIGMVHAAMEEGYQYVIESDIEDFFPSVDLDHLCRLLEFYIPQNDIILKNILFKCIRNGYVLNGMHCLRAQGLAQGSPLSPVLANLYLDSFDEEIRKWNVKMVRYADDFIILAKTKENAEQVLSRTEDPARPGGRNGNQFIESKGRGDFLAGIPLRIKTLEILANELPLSFFS